jgi:hypothetical protein
MQCANHGSNSMSHTCCLCLFAAVADSAGANILVAALTALRDISSGSSMGALVKEAVAQTAAVAATSDQYHSADAAAEVESAVAELFTSLSARLYAINSSSSSSTSDADLLSRAGSSNSSNGSNSSSSYQNGRNSSLATALSSSGSTIVSDMMVQIEGNADSTHAAGSAAAAAAGFVPPAAVVLVSPAMDISEQACFYDEEWRAKHEPR